MRSRPNPIHPPGQWYRAMRTGKMYFGRGAATQVIDVPRGRLVCYMNAVMDSGHVERWFTFDGHHVWTNADAFDWLLPCAAPQPVIAGGAVGGQDGPQDARRALEGAGTGGKASKRVSVGRKRPVGASGGAGKGAKAGGKCRVCGRAG